MQISPFWQKKTVRIDTFFFLEDKKEVFNPDDFEFNIIEKIKKLKYHQREFLEENYDTSIRKIGEKFNVNYGFVYKELKKAKDEVLNGVKLRKYNNVNEKKITKL